MMLATSPRLHVESAAGASGGQRNVRVEVRGTVQGVGFRPYVYRLATALGLRGDVCNAGGHVLIQAGGPAPAVAAFLRRLPAEAPSAAAITRMTAVDMPPASLIAEVFRVASSTRVDSPDAGAVAPDLATCSACLAELFNPADRRYRYPFSTCVDCGPRATIIDELPYDRERTAMAGFPLCAACSREYRDPTDRRFHAEPVACPECGPQLWWRPPGSRAAPLRREDALAAGVAVVAAGGLVAVKGLGGYQLVCDAAAAAAVSRIRAVKRRPTKPLAVMVASLDMARALGELSADEEEMLRQPVRPIVLVRRRAGTDEAVCGDLPEIGLFLPTTPLHHLLLDALARPLVVTSGNLAGEPIAVDDDEALRTLGPLVDGVLGHDRPIRSRCDDSVTRVVAGRTTVIRRARGYAPAPLPMPVTAPEPVLAVGAQLKHTAAIAVGGQVVVGPHTGDLENAPTLDAFTATVQRLCRWWSVAPRFVVHDLHPGYLSTQYAHDQVAAPYRVVVQHHHAHVAAVAAEHGLTGPFLGVAYDGLGLGDDGTLWGGELLLATYTGYRRLARFARAPVPGGAAAVRRPARMALGYLCGAEDLGAPPLDPASAADLLARLEPREVAVVERMVQRRVNTPVASSAGRLFDAVASLLGLVDQVSYEGEAAVRLEAAAASHLSVAALPWRLTRRDGLCVYDPVPTLRAVLASGQPPGWIAAAFHATLAEVTCALVADAAERTGVTQVCLGGGVFANQRLTTDLLDRLARAGFDVHTGHQVPVNDGGISYGQAAVAAARLAEE